MSIVTNASLRAQHSSSSSTFQYPQLTNTNYTSWVIRVQAMIEDQGVWEAVELAKGAVVDVWLDKKARSHLLQALPEDLLMQVVKKTMAKEVWDCLKTRFVGADRIKNTRLQTLKSDFDAMRMNDDESLDQYADRLTGMSIRYANLGGTLNDAEMVKKLFDTVPEQFLSVITAIKQFYDLDKMLFEEAVGRLKTYEERTHPRAVGGGGISDGQILYTQTMCEVRQKKDGVDSSSSNKGKASADSGNRSRGRSRGSRGGLPRKDRASGSGSSGRDKSHIRCFNYDELGHYSTQCRSPMKKEEAHLVRADVIESALLLAVSEEISLVRQESHNIILLNEENVSPEFLIVERAEASTDVWYLDNGASNHMTGDKEKFRELD